MAEEVTPAQRRADALGLLAEAALAADLDRGSRRRPLSGGAARGGVHGCGGRGRSVGDPRGRSRRRRRFRGNVAPPRVRRLGGGDASRHRRRRARRRAQDAHHSARHPPRAEARDAAVGSLAAPPAAATLITWSTGPTAAPPASTTWCCCAGAITGPSTKADSQWKLLGDGTTTFLRPDGTVLDPAPGDAGLIRPARRHLERARRHSRVGRHAVRPRLRHRRALRAEPLKRPCPRDNRPIVIGVRGGPRWRGTCGACASRCSSRPDRSSRSARASRRSCPSRSRRRDARAADRAGVRGDVLLAVACPRPPAVRLGRQTATRTQPAAVR